MIILFKGTTSTTNTSMLKSMKIEMKQKAFLRKPRSLLFNSKKSELNDLMITDSLDSGMQFWSVKNRKFLNGISSSKNGQSMPEAMVWNERQDTLFWGFSTSSEDSFNSQLTILKDFNINSGEVAFHKIESSCRPHSKKGICALSTFNFGSSYDGLLTGGFDKKSVSACVTFSFYGRSILLQRLK